MQVFPFSQSVTNIIARGNFIAVYACELHFKDQTVRAHTGTGELTLDGVTYLGVGDFGNIGSAREGISSSSPRSIDLSLSGLDAVILSETNLKGCRGRAGRVLFVVVDEAGNYAADILISGRMDAATFAYSGNVGENAITVTVVDRMAEWQRTGTERWTDESHRARHGNDDRFFYAVAQMAEWPIYWGAKKDAPSFKYS